MKRAILAATVLLTSTIMSTPTFADTIPNPDAAAADGTTLAAMQSQCDALAAAHDTANGDVWTGDVVEGAVTLIAGPTEVGGTRVKDNSSVVGTGTYVPAALEIRGVPFKNGGSVNLFGDQWSTAGYYPDSTYNYTADFASTFSHAFSCNINQSVYHPEVEIPGEFHPAVAAVGCYTNPGHSSCVVGDNWCTDEAGANWGRSYGNCVWHGVSPGQEEYTDPPTYEPEYWDAAAQVGNEPGIAVNQDQTDSLDAFEDHGGVVQVTGEFHVGQPVICNSPGPKGGTWRTQNGYNGGSLTGPAAGCNTPYFKIAPTYHGSTTSNGTFTSVPNYN